jgi:hypothetical protein
VAKIKITEHKSQKKNLEYKEPRSQDAKNQRRKAKEIQRETKKIQAKNFKGPPNCTAPKKLDTNWGHFYV